MRSKMAPVCLAGRQSRLLSLLFVIALFLCVCCWDVSALFAYDHQALLNIRVSDESLTLLKHELGDQTASLPPLLADIPSYLRRSPCAPPRKKRQRRRGKRGGVLVKVKAYLSLSCAADPRLLRGGFCYSSAVRRSIQLRGPWLRIVIPSPPAAAVPGLTMLSGTPMDAAPATSPLSSASAGRTTTPVPLAVTHGSLAAPAQCGLMSVSLPGQLRVPRGNVVHTNLRPLRRASTSMTPNVTLRMALINATSLANKTFLLNDFFTSRKLDFMFVTETWLHTGESIPFSELLPPDCTFLSSPRTTGKGGGLACVFKSSFHCQQIPSVTYSSFELQLFKLNSSTQIQKEFY